MNNECSGFRRWLGIVAPVVLMGSLYTLTLHASRVTAQGSGYSLRFYGNGVNDIDRVKILIDGPPVPADVGVRDFTLEWWMKANLIENDSESCTTGNDGWITGNTLFDRDIWGDGDYGDYGVSLAGGRLAFGVNNGTSGEGICGATDVADGAWHHVAVTRRRSDGLMRIFVDGQIDAQADGPEGDLSYRDGRSTGFEDDPYLVIGAEKHDAGSSYPSYSGWIDEVRLSNTIRYTSDFTSPDVLFIPDANTVALYHLDEGPAGPCTGTVPDSSGASGGPSNGFCRYGGAPAGPVYTTDTPFTNTAPTPTPTPDTAPPLISDEEAAPLDIVAWVAWNTNEPATSQVEYGISPTLSLSTTETRDYVTAHKVTLTGLSPGTAYVYRVHSKDGADNATVSAEFGFTTLASQDVRRIYLPLILKSF